jgi:Ni,Fe-hydrogenase III large subunit
VGGSSEGDVDARIWVRFDEIKSSINIIDQIAGRKLTGSALVELPLHKGKSLEGLALVEGFRGDIFCWVRVKENNRIDRCHLRDPSWFQWPLLEYAIKGNIVADFPLCNKSFNCSYSGHDL